MAGKPKHPGGRPTKYKPEYCEKIIKYFNIPITDEQGNANDPPYIQEFCLSIRINKSTLQEWVGKYPEFSNAYSIAKAKQKQLIITNALQNRYNASFAWKSMMNMFNWRDQQYLKVGMDEETLNILLNALPEEQRKAVKEALLKHVK